MRWISLVPRNNRAMSFYSAPWICSDYHSRSSVFLAPVFLTTNKCRLQSRSERNDHPSRRQDAERRIIGFGVPNDRMPIRPGRDLDRRSVFRQESRYSYLAGYRGCVYLPRTCSIMNAYRFAPGFSSNSTGISQPMSCSQKAWIRSPAWPDCERGVFVMDRRQPDLGQGVAALVRRQSMVMMLRRYLCNHQRVTAESRPAPLVLLELPMTAQALRNGNALGQRDRRDSRFTISILDRRYFATIARRESRSPGMQYRSSRSARLRIAYYLAAKPHSESRSAR